MNDPVTGHCLCGGVSFVVTFSTENGINLCHCQMCRKQTGTLFSSWAIAERSAFSWQSGEDQIQSYPSSPGHERTFCSVCGSQVPMTGGNQVAIPMGLLNEDPGIRPQRHLFAASAYAGYPISDELPQFEAAPPEWGQRPERSDAGDTIPGMINGGCLCGTLRFHITAPPTKIMHCHCSRCRKSRASAHVSNLYIDPDTFVWNAGEENVTLYTLTDTQHTIGFCKSCGATAPLVFPGLAIVPVGNLDDVVDVSNAPHIFCGSKAPWFTVMGQVPQFDTTPG